MKKRLREVEENFERQMRQRGLTSPGRADSLTVPLAKLYAEREELRADLEALKGIPRAKRLVEQKRMSEIERIETS